MDYDHQPPPLDLSQGILSMANKGGISLRNEWGRGMLIINGGVQPCLLQKCDKRKAVILGCIRSQKGIYLTEPTSFHLIPVSSQPQTSNIEIHYPEGKRVSRRSGPSTTVPTRKRRAHLEGSGTIVRRGHYTVPTRKRRASTFGWGEQKMLG